MADDQETRLLRSGEHGIVAGVCAGLARRTGVDAVIYRVAFGVLAFVQGLGLVAYGLAWLLLPDERDAEPPVRRLLGGHLDGRAVAAIAVLVLGLAVGPTFFFVYDAAALLIALACVLGLAVLVARGRGMSLSDMVGAVRRRTEPETAPRPSAPAGASTPASEEPRHPRRDPADGRPDSPPVSGSLGQLALSCPKVFPTGRDRLTLAGSPQ